MLYDNTRIAVKEIAGDGERKSTEAFSGLQSHYLFVVKLGQPGKSNDKGNGEGLVGYARRNFMVPVPRAASWEKVERALAGSVHPAAESCGLIKKPSPRDSSATGEAVAEAAGTPGSM